MNAFTSTRSEPRRVRFSLGDVDLMVARGLLAENARVELIDGDLIQMPSEGGPHIDYKIALTRWFVLALPDAFVLAPAATLRLSDYDAPEPDLYIFPAALRGGEARGPDVALVVEISDTTKSYDLRLKAALYAKGGVAEYWVVDIASRCVHVHTQLALTGYGEVRVVDHADPLAPQALPGLALRIDDLERLRR